MGSTVFIVRFYKKLYSTRRNLEDTNLALNARRLRGAKRLIRADRRALRLAGHAGARNEP